MNPVTVCDIGDWTFSLHEDSARRLVLAFNSPSYATRNFALTPVQAATLQMHLGDWLATQDNIVRWEQVCHDRWEAFHHGYHLSVFTHDGKRFYTQVFRTPAGHEPRGPDYPNLDEAKLGAVTCANARYGTDGRGSHVVLSPAPVPPVGEFDGPKRVIRI